MIFAAFIILVLGMFIAGLNILPVADPFNTGIVTSINLIVGYMKAWNFIFPISEIFIVAGLSTTYYVIILI